MKKKNIIDITQKENTKLSELADFTVNTVPNQATKTVRTEEAIFTTLAIFNLLIRKKC